MTPEKLPEIASGSGVHQVSDRNKEAALKALRDQDGEMDAI